MDKAKVAEILVEIGTPLELKGENPFKTRAYNNAAHFPQRFQNAHFFLLDGDGDEEWRCRCHFGNKVDALDLV